MMGFLDTAGNIAGVLIEAGQREQERLRGRQPGRIFFEKMLFERECT